MLYTAAEGGGSDSEEEQRGGELGCCGEGDLGAPLREKKWNLQELLTRL